MFKKLSHLLFLTVFVTTIGIAQSNLEEKTESTPISTIEFEETEFAWGEIYEGEKIQNVFTFTNTGDEPLIILNAKGSCGCTVPRYPKDAIMPGETADLLVQFDSKNKGSAKGTKQSKRVTLTCNTEPKNIYLTIKGTVFKKEKEEAKAIERHDNFDFDADRFKLYPNPTSHVLNIEVEDLVGNAIDIDLFNAMGQKVSTQNVKSITNDKITLDVRDLPKGTYTVSLKMEGKNRIARQFQVL